MKIIYLNDYKYTYKSITIAQWITLRLRWNSINGLLPDLHNWQQKGVGITTNILSRNIFIKVTNLGFKRQTVLPKIEDSDKDDAT